MLILFFSFAVFVLGLIIGSFLNCLIYRLETGGSFLKGRSFCPDCKHQLAWQDLIPLFSFLFLKGKCRYCQRKISRQYPLVELFSGFVFLSVFIFKLSSYGQCSVLDFLNLAYCWAVSSFLIAIFVYDLKHYLIPSQLIYPAIGIVFFYRFFEFSFAFFEGKNISEPILATVSAFLAATFFFLIVLVSKGKWMGAGDISLTFFMGLFLGWPGILVALFSAFYLGAILGLGLVISGKKKMRSEIPFAPFLIVGTFLALFWGQELVAWYQALFLLK